MKGQQQEHNKYFGIKVECELEASEVSENSKEIQEFANKNQYQHFKLPQHWTSFSKDPIEKGSYIGFKVSLNEMKFESSKKSQAVNKLVPIVFWSGKNRITFTCEETKKVFSFILDTNQKPFEPLIYRQESQQATLLQKAGKDGKFAISTTIEDMIKEEWKWGDTGKDFETRLICLENPNYSLQIICSTITTNDERQLPLLCFGGGRKYGWKCGAFMYHQKQNLLKQKEDKNKEEKAKKKKQKKSKAKIKKKNQEQEQEQKIKTMIVSIPVHSIDQNNEGKILEIRSGTIGMLMQEGEQMYGITCAHIFYSSKKEKEINQEMDIKGKHAFVLLWNEEENKKEFCSIGIVDNFNISKDICQIQLNKEFCAQIKYPQPASETQPIKTTPTILSTSTSISTSTSTSTSTSIVNVLNTNKNTIIEIVNKIT